MANSKITLTFNSIPDLDTEITIVDSLTGIDMVEVFKNQRNTSGETVLSSLLSSTQYIYNINFGLDYNITSLYDLSNVSNSIVITAENPLSQFSVTSNTTNGAITTVIENEALPPVFEITNTLIEESLVSACNNVKVSITTNEQGDSILSPTSETITTNPIVFELPRQITPHVIFLEKDGLYATIDIVLPKLLTSYFQIQDLSTPSSSIIQVLKLEPFNIANDLILEYSLDNTIWQTSSYFNNIGIGSHTLYIKDQIGCSINIPFSISEFTANLVDYEGIAEISNLNSIRYKEDVVWSDSVLKTPSNTLSFEENVKLPNRAFTQPFVKEIITTQIKSNYSTITAKIIDSIGNETPLIVSKKTANMNITDVRDVSINSINFGGSDYTSIDYNGGKTYDPITLDELSDYNIGESVPEWINKDDYINLEGVGWYKVLDIVYGVDSYVVVINLLFADFPFTIPKTLKATTVYNVLDYENYEFNSDFTNLEGYYKIQVNMTDSSFLPKQFLSEWLDIREAHNNTVLVEVYNSENNEINYATGIKNKLRIKLADDLKWKPNSEIDLYVTDTNTVNLDTKYRGFWDLSSYPLPTVMAEKLVLMLLQDRIFIDGVNYISEGEPESAPIGSEYQIKGALVKSNYVYELYSGKGEITIETTGVPLSISSGGGFLLVE